jgi:MYXO-CTERM domain-containing protein
MRTVRNARLAALLALSVVACADGGVDSVDVVDEGVIAELAAAGLHVTPAKKKAQPFIRPRGITLEVPWEHSKASGAVDTFIGEDHTDGAIAFAGPGQPPLKIFMNRNGGTYSPGSDDSRRNTSIVPRTTSTIQPFPFGNAAWNGIVECVRDQFAQFNVEIVETEPPSNVRYVEHVVGGRPQDVGLPNGVGGVAPIDNFNCGIIDVAINYTFAEVYGGDVQSICETAAQEIAHSFSLDHAFFCPDPMTYLGGCGDKTFQNSERNCGEFEPRQCNCNRATQNSVRIMLEKLGANGGGGVEPPPVDPTPPAVSITSPANNATLLENSTIVITATASDNLAIANTVLNWDFTGDAFECPTNFGGGAVTCTRTGNTSTWNVRVGVGARTFSVTAIDTAGNAVTTNNRTINLAADGQPPPDPVDDSVAPTTAISAPADGAVLAANTTMQVVATASDDTALASVELLWASTGDTFPCPFEGQAITCAVSGPTYTWTLNVGVGNRSFSVRAIDTAGNAAVTPERSITLSADGAVNPNADIVGEDNDTSADAFAIRCGNAIDLVVDDTDEDWFAVDAPADTAVEIGIDTAAGNVVGVELFNADGTQSLISAADIIDAGGQVRAVSAGPAVLARITTTGNDISYRLAATCSAEGGDTPIPGVDDDLEENDTKETATRAFCGQTRSQLTAADDDFFVVEVREGDSVNVALVGTGVEARVVDGADAVLAGPGVDITTEALPAGDYLVKVNNTGAEAFYDVAFTCAVALPDSVTAKGCGGCQSSDGAAAGVAGLALLALRRRRR